MEPRTGREVDETDRRKLEEAVARAEQDFYAETRESQAFGADCGAYAPTLEPETASRWMFRIGSAGSPRGAHATDRRG
jgi:hypothetical protein